MFGLLKRLLPEKKRILVYEARGCMAHIRHNQKWGYITRRFNRKDGYGVILKMATVTFDDGSNKEIFAANHEIFDAGTHLESSY